MALPEHVAALITEPNVPAWVSQRQAMRYELAWQELAEEVVVQLLAQPDAPDGLVLATARGVQSVWVETDALRPFFALSFADGRRLVVAERILPLAGGPNLRDVGGYVGENGRFIRWGAIYRSGTLHKLTTADLDYLAHLGINTVCDLRTRMEVAKLPDQLPHPSPRHINLALESKDGRLRRLWDLWRHRNCFDDLLAIGYTRLILEQNAPRLSMFLHQAAEANGLPLLVHCTAGKDRTGVLVAILLLLLGVDEATVLADYSLSNYFYHDFRRLLAEDIEQLLRFGYDPVQLEPFYVADPAILRRALAYIRRKYGSIARFVMDVAGVPPAVLAQLRANLLV
ncbi:MAG: tyrosine-protein phosphatase [Ardenticatenaceae bacterium]|nr:tyrosine-protein phosphatase [Ardenticatenaceae bacterium]